MTDFHASGVARQILAAQQGIAKQIGLAQLRLATGKKVNSALDNPAVFFTASALNARAGELNKRLDDIGLNMESIKAADSALSAMISLIESQKSSLNDALASEQTVATATGDIDITAFAEVVDIPGVSNNERFSVEVGGAGEVDITIQNGDTPQDLLDKINAIANVSASYTAQGYLQISATNGEDLTLDNEQGSPLRDFGLVNSDNDVVFTGSVSSARTSAALNFDSFRTQLNKLVADAGFNGVNLLQSDSLKVLFNEDGSSSLSADGVDFDSSGLGINAATVGFQTDVSIESAKAELDATLSTLKEQAAKFGNHLAVIEARETFTRDMIGHLGAGADTLTVADLDAESANLLALQSRQELAAALLSLVAQADQNVLRMF